MSEPTRDATASDDTTAPARVQLEVAGHAPVPFDADSTARFVVDGHAVLGVRLDAGNGTLTVGTWDEGRNWIPIHAEKTLVENRWGLRVLNRDRRWPQIALDAPDALVATERALEWARTTVQLPDPIVVDTDDLGDGRWQVDIEGW